MWKYMSSQLFAFWNLSNSPHNLKVQHGLHKRFTFAWNGDKTGPGIFSLLLALGISHEVVFAGVVM